MRAVLLVALFAATLAAQPRRVLYITHSAGFVHGSIGHSVEVLRALGAQSEIEVAATADVSRINAATLAGYDAVFFYTSGELPISAQQKSDLLAFVRGGRGFGGVHSATDTFYGWPEYGDLIGGYFNGHPWVQEVTIAAEDPEHPIVAHLAPSFRIAEEIYQFREFSRSRARVLLRLDTSSVNLHAPGVNPGTTDFPLVWTRAYGSGRVFYNALGHLDETWDHPGFRQMMLQALRWLTGQIEGESTPRAAGAPTFDANGVANAASFRPAGSVSAGSLISIFGENLTAGSTLAASLAGPLYDLAGTTLSVNGSAVPLFYVSPTQVNAYVPLDVEPRPWFDLTLSAGGRATTARANAATVTPGVFATTRQSNVLILWATGLGPVERRGDLFWTTEPLSVSVALQPAQVQFSGLAPGYLGLYQVNVELPPLPPEGPALVRLEVAGQTLSWFLFP